MTWLKRTRVNWQAGGPSRRCIIQCTEWTCLSAAWSPTWHWPIDIFVHRCGFAAGRSDAVQFLMRRVEWDITACIAVKCDPLLYVAVAAAFLSVILSWSIYLSMFVCRFSPLQTAVVTGPAARRVQPVCGCTNIQSGPKSKPLQIYW